MEQLLKQNEIAKLQDTFKTHPILLTCYKLFIPLKGRLNGLLVTPDDVFCQTAWLLDYLLCKPDTNQHQVDSLWDMLLNRIRDWKPDVTKHDKQVVTGTVFMLVRALLTQHTESIYHETISELLDNKIRLELKEHDEKDWEKFCQQLMEQSLVLSEWINSYDEADEWLSDQIAYAIARTGGVSNEKTFIPSGRTFSKTSLLPDRLIDIIGQRLSQANKLDASPDDFRKLFSGIDQQFTMTWKGTGGELRDLFKMLTDKGYAKPKRGYQQILKSHFLDENNQRFDNLHGDKSIEGFQPVIDDCAFLLQHLTESMTEIMKRLIKANKAALTEMGYFNQLQAAKQSGMRIQNRRR